MSKYFKIRKQAIQLLQETRDGDLITDPDELAAHFDLTLLDFVQHVYTKKIADLLEKNKALMKASIRKRWFISNRTQAMENVYKLLATSDELHRLKGEGNEANSFGSDPLIEALNPKEIWNETD